MSNFTTIAPKYRQTAVRQKGASERLFVMLDISDADDVLDLCPLPLSLVFFRNRRGICRYIRRNIFQNIEPFEKCLSSPNAFIGDPFILDSQNLDSGLKPAGITDFSILQEAPWQQSLFMKSADELINCRIDED